MDRLFAVSLAELKLDPVRHIKSSFEFGVHRNRQATVNCESCRCNFRHGFSGAFDALMALKAMSGPTCAAYPAVR